jgi:adenosylcobinamide-GDP ribazoletransferase
MIFSGRSFIVTWHFLTAVPLTSRCHDPTAKELGESMAWFPIVGLVLGSLLAVSAYLLSAIFARAVSDGLLLMMLVVLTRGLHQDGLADTFDGWMGGQTAQRRLEIMKDARIGAVGATALILALGLRYLCFGALPESHRLATLFCMPAVGRWAMVLGAFSAPYARAEGGLGEGFLKNLSVWQLLVATACVAVALAWTLGVAVAVFSIMLLTLVTLALTGLARRLCHGITGDTLGAINEITEITFVLLVPVFLSVR